MTDFVPVTNAANVTMAFSQYTGEIAQQGFWVQRDEAWDATSLLAMCAIFKTWWETGDGTHAPKGFVHPLNKLEEIAARDYTTISSANVTYGDGLPLAGDRTGEDELTAGITFPLTTRTGHSGKSKRGRTFIVGLTRQFILTGSGSFADPAQVTNLVSAYDALISAITDGDSHAQLVVAHRFEQAVPMGPSLPMTLGTTTPVIAFGSHSLAMCFQRRRAPGHNRHH